MPTANDATKLLDTAADIVKAFMDARPGLAPEQAVALVGQVYEKLVGMAATAAQPMASQPLVAPAAAPRGEPAVPVDQSITADGEFIICLEDGTKHKMMKRYLKRVHNMTPDEYRARWGLDANYPMTAPAYSAQKRDEAMAVGLGTAANKAGAPAKVAIAA